MVNIKKLAQRPKIFHTLCGLTPRQFNTLLNELEPLWSEAEYKRRNWKGRKRKIGGGDKPKLTLAQQLFMLLMFYRTYAGQVFIGMVVGLDDSNVSRRIRRLEPVLAQIFRIPQKRIDLTNDELWELIVDATEQETQRRKGTGYSGKKHQQTIKTQIHVSKNGYIKAVSSSITGNRHDKYLYDVIRSDETTRREDAALVIRAPRDAGSAKHRLRALTLNLLTNWIRDCNRVRCQKKRRDTFFPRESGVFCLITAPRDMVFNPMAGMGTTSGLDSTLPPYLIFWIAAAKKQAPYSPDLCLHSAAARKWRFLRSSLRNHIAGKSGDDDLLKALQKAQLNATMQK